MEEDEEFALLSLQSTESLESIAKKLDEIFEDIDHISKNPQEAKLVLMLMYGLAIAPIKMELVRRKEPTTATISEEV